MELGKILFHNNQISERGESTNLVSNSSFLKSIYKLHSIFAAPHSRFNNHLHIQELRDSGNVVFIYRTLQELQRYCERQGVSHVVWMNDGRYSNLWVPNTKNVVHAVFNNFEPYGDRYAYVSSWLFKAAMASKRGRLRSEVEADRKLTNSPYTIDRSLEIGWVPHTVSTETGDGETFRKKFGIPKYAKVIGRIGALTEFNDPEARKCIINLVDKSDYFFIFVNTFPFVIHKRIRYLGYISTKDKWDFYAACNLLLNGRLMGESFGYSIIEPLMLGKPVIAPHKLRNVNMDCHHIEVLKGHPLLYKNSSHMARLITDQLDNPVIPEELRSLVNKFTPEKVAKKFFEFFLK